ncbi:MAG: hypothetical protein H6Q90_2566 [Deltaproteobacteria bacterium]|nr:hypothetical protein [Deltaproteobacteria bacterium]
MLCGEMPFTAAHVLAVLPGLRWHSRLRLDPTCLVIGSMAPDFEYFVRGELVGRYSHTFVGIAGWGVPVTLVVAALYHHVVKWPVLLAAPAAITPLLARPWQARWTVGAVISVVVSAALGDLTHLLWDGLTHANGVFVRRIPELHAPYDLPVVGGMVTHRILQHTSTILGLLGVGWFTLRRIRHAAGPPRQARRARARWIMVGCLAVGIALLEIRLVSMHVRDPGSVITAAISGSLAGAIVAGLFLRGAGQAYARQVGMATASPKRVGQASS